jgi:hypothetical protein
VLVGAITAIETSVVEVADALTIVGADGATIISSPTPIVTSTEPEHVDPPVTVVVAVIV